MDQFALTEDQKAVVQAVRRVVKESVEPRAGDIDAKAEFPSPGTSRSSLQGWASWEQEYPRPMGGPTKGF
jgi:hypothetical protein